jgi:hypothetical protein
MVARLRGGALSWGTIFKREILGRMLNEVTVLGYAAALFGKKRQTLGDRIAGTAVVKGRVGLPMRRLAPIVSVGSVVLLLVALPVMLEFDDIDTRLGAAVVEGDPSVYEVVGRLDFLSTREVVSDKEYRADLDTMLAIADQHLAQASEVRAQTADWYWKARVFTPLWTAKAAQADSMGTLLESCIQSARLFAVHGLKAKSSTGPDSVRAARAADYALSDMMADKEYIETLMQRLGWRDEL